MEPLARRAVGGLVLGVAGAGAWLAASRGGSGPPTAGADDRSAATDRPQAPSSRRRAAAPVDPATHTASAATHTVGKDAVIATMTGRVVDAVTGRPVAGASLLWGYTVPGKDDLEHALWGGTADDGALSFVYPRTGHWAPDGEDDVAELWVAAAGYATAKICAPEPVVEVRLRPAPDRAPGDLRVHAVRGDGLPWSGLVRVWAADDFGRADRLCGIADDDGRVTLLAVPVRQCRVRLDDRVPWTPIAVVSCGVADVELRGAPPGPFASASASEIVARRDAAAKEVESAKAAGDAARAARAEAVFKDAWDEMEHRLPEQRPFAVTNLPADAVPPVVVQVSPKGQGNIIWRLPIRNRQVTLSTRRDGPHWWSISVTRPAGTVESRGITIVGPRDGRMEAATGAADATKRSFPLGEDGALEVGWEQLVPE